MDEDFNNKGSSAIRVRWQSDCTPLRSVCHGSPQSPCMVIPTKHFEIILYGVAFTLYRRSTLNLTHLVFLFFFKLLLWAWDI